MSTSQQGNNGRTSERKSAKPKYQGPKAKARNILEIKEWKEFLDSFDFVMSEIEGVVWKVTSPVPGAAEAVTKLKNAGKQYKFVTSDSTRTDEDMVALLKKVGIPEVKTIDLVHPAKTIARFLTHYKEGKSVYSLCPRHVNKLLAKTGANIISLETSTTLKLDNIRDIVKPTNKVYSVILDLNFNITYAQLARAQQYLLNPYCSLLVGSTNATQPINEGISSIGNAGFVDLLKQHAKGELIILGKPGKVVGDDIVKEFHITDRKRVLFIGNSLMNDITFAVDCGFQSLLVFSGSAKIEDMSALPDSLKPDYVANSLADIAEFFTLHNLS